MSLLDQYLVRGRSNSEPISLENSGKRVREDVSFEESESTPPTKVERKKSPDKKELGKAAPDWAQLIYNEIFEIKLQVRSVVDMKEEIKGEIRSEINDFKQIMEREQQELKSSIQFISDQYDSLKTSQQTNEEKCVTLKNENICMKGTISNLFNKIDELEQYSRRNCLLINGIKEVDPPKENVSEETIEVSTQENTDIAVLLLFNEKLGVDVHIKDIDRTHRIGRQKQKNKGAPRPIIVKFSNDNTRQRVFQARRKLKGTQITIVENLTSKRVAILSKVRNKFGVRNVWSLDGRIFAVVEGVKTRIDSIEQIDGLGV